MSLATERQETAAEASAHSCYKGVLSCFGVLVKFCASPVAGCGCGPMKVVQQGTVGVLTRFGVFQKVLEPGLYAYNPLTENIINVTKKVQVLDIPAQQAMTKDNLTVRVDGVAFFKVVDARRAVFEVKMYSLAMKTLVAATLLHIIAEHDLQQLFTERAIINSKLTQTMKEKTSNWGIDVDGVELLDLTIPESLQRAMAQIAVATREADAKVITARGQNKASSLFAEAADTMSKQPTSLQLQWFETLRQIASEKPSTIIVPDALVGSLSSSVQYNATA